MQDFFQNVSRYPRFLISVSLGIFWAFFEKLAPFLKNPVTAVAVISLGVGTFAFLYLTLEAMLGIN
jgi:Protein of unknown function (DUF751)